MLVSRRQSVSPSTLAARVKRLLGDRWDGLDRMTSDPEHFTRWPPRSAVAMQHHRIHFRNGVFLVGTITVGMTTTPGTIQIIYAFVGVYPFWVGVTSHTGRHVIGAYPAQSARHESRIVLCRVGLKRCALGVQIVFGGFVLPA